MNRIHPYYVDYKTTIKIVTLKFDFVSTVVLPFHSLKDIFKDL